MRIARYLFLLILTAVVLSCTSYTYAANATTHPDATNTGPTGTLQAQSGNQTLGDGQTLQNMNLTGCVTVTGSNVAIKNSKITCGGGTAAILLNTAGTHDIRIENVETTMPSGQGVAIYMGAVSNITVKAVNASNAGDIIMLNNPNGVTIRDSWLHDPQLGGHVDVIQVVGGKNITIQNNSLKLTTGTAAGGNGYVANVIAKADLGVIDNITIDSNFSQGGSVPYYCMAGNDPQNSNSSGQFAAPTNCHITNNTIVGGSFTYTVPIIVNQAAGEVIDCNKLTDGSNAKVARNDRGGGIFTSTCTGGGITPSVNPSTNPTITGDTNSCPATKSKGDADCNGTVTLVDYQIWKNIFLEIDASLKADFNSDSKVTLVDYAIWRTTFVGGGTTPSVSPGITPGQSGCPSNGKFSLEGALICDPDGQPFLPRGINIAGADSYQGFLSGVGRAADLQTRWNLNFVRLFYCRDCTKSHAPGSTHYGTIDAFVQEYTSKKMVVMIDNHEGDHGGDRTPAEREAAKQLFTQLATQYKDNPYVWFEPFNEPLDIYKGTLTPQYWVDLHMPIINAIRDAGNTNMIVVNAPYYGQDKSGFGAFNQAESYIINYGSQVTGRGNVMFDIHFYDRWGNPADDVNSTAKYFKAIHQKGFAVLAGEFGGFSGPAVNAAESLYRVHPAGVGLVPWPGYVQVDKGQNDGGPQNPLHWAWTHNPPSAIPD